MYAIWGIPEKKRIRIGISNACFSPFPFGAEIITLVEPCDVKLMRRWCERRAKRGWSINRMRQACGEI